MNSAKRPGARLNPDSPAVTKPVVLPFTLTVGDDPGAPGRRLALAKGELTISRLAYGIGQGEWTATKTVGDQVVIDFDLRASRPR